MFYKKNTSRSGFTLVELLVVIFVVGIIAASATSINIREINDRKKLELFTNEISRVFENTRNNALLGRSIYDQNPDAWRVSIDFTDGGTFLTEYELSGVWERYDDPDYTFSVEKLHLIDLINCNISGDITSGVAIVTFTGDQLEYSGACGSNDKLLTIEASYAGSEGSVQINSVSGVIETEY